MTPRRPRQKNTTGNIKLNSKKSSDRKTLKVRSGPVDMSTSLKCAAETCSCKDIVDYNSDNGVKAAALRVSSSVVSVVTHNVPDAMILNGKYRMQFRDNRKYACPGSGVILQCDDAGDGIYFSTILAPADLFKRTNDLQPQQIEVDVRVSGGKLYKGELLACDFHFNLAAIRIQSGSPLQPATVRQLNDATSIDVDTNQNLNSQRERPCKRRRLSILDSFKVQSGTKIMAVRRFWTGQFEILVSTGVFSTRDRTAMRYKELFTVKGSEGKCRGGGAAINYYGEVIGIFFSNASFLPINLVSRWWDHYKSCRLFHRPCLGVKVANLHEANSNFLDQFVREFPNIVTGVVVIKVEENSPAHRSGIKRGDVLTQCDGNLIQSKLQFFERVWDNASGVVELNVLKVRDGAQLNVNMTIEDTAPDKLYKWELPEWWGFTD